MNWVEFSKDKNKLYSIIIQEVSSLYDLSFLATMTIQQLKGIIQRSLKVQNIKQKLSYLDEKVIYGHIFV